MLERALFSAFQGLKATLDVQDVADGVPTRLFHDGRRTTVAGPRGSLRRSDTRRDLREGERRSPSRRRTARGGASRELLKERPEGHILVEGFGRATLVQGERFAHGHTLRTRAARGRLKKRVFTRRPFN